MMPAYLHWHPETLFVTAALAHDLGSAVIPDAVGRQAFTRSTNVVGWASRHKMLDQCARYAASIGLPGEELRAAGRRAAMRAMQTAAVSAAAYRVLAQAQCRPLAIKGAVLAILTGDGVISRGVGDVDLAVAPQRFATAVDALVGAGAVLTSDPQVGWRMHAANLRWRGSAIDLHHRLDKSPTFGCDLDTLWERGQEIEVAGESLRTLSVADTAVYVAVAAGMDTWSQLIRLKDFDRMLSATVGAAGGQDLLWRTAGEWRAENLLRLGLAMIRRLKPRTGRQSRSAEALASQAWLWMAQGRQLRLDQDLASRTERDVFRVLAVSRADFFAWSVARNASRLWPSRQWTPEIR